MRDDSGLNGLARALSLENEATVEEMPALDARALRHEQRQKRFRAPGDLTVQHQRLGQVSRHHAVVAFRVFSGDQRDPPRSAPFWTWTWEAVLVALGSRPSGHGVTGSSRLRDTETRTNLGENHHICRC